MIENFNEIALYETSLIILPLNPRSDVSLFSHSNPLVQNLHVHPVLILAGRDTLGVRDALFLLVGGLVLVFAFLLEGRLLVLLVLGPVIMRNASIGAQ